MTSEDSKAVHDANGAKVRALLIKQPHFTLRIIAQELNIGKGTIRTILTEKMNR